MSKIIFLLLTTLLLASCNNWVQVTREGQSVRLVTASDVMNCARVGSTQAQTLGRVIGLERGAERLQEELSRIARNEAGDLGGNAIVPESLIADGRQTFGVYRCP
jgi:hypothetical protein